MPSTPVRDPFGRSVEYLRVSVTDRCDLRCAYCMPRGYRDFEPTDTWLTFEEIERVVRLFAHLGVRRVRLTGGEPLLRRDLPALAAALAKVPGIEDLSLSTNATRLSRHAAALARAGIARVNVSLDTLRPERFRRITGRDALRDVLSGLDAAAEEGLAPIKINMVVLDENKDEVDDMVEFCAQRRFILRLIETMPVGAGRKLPRADLQPLRRRLQARYGLVDAVLPGGGPARYLRSLDGRLSIGFITPLSQHFCATCNRVRLSVEGTLHLCLGQENRVALRPLLRSGADDATILALLERAVMSKPESHGFDGPRGSLIRVMAKTGG